MIPIQEDPNHQANSFSDTTVIAAQNNTLFAVNAEVARFNAAKVQDYEEQWKKYAQSRDERPDATNLIAPVPARAEAVFVDERGWPYVDTTYQPVTAPHTYVPPVTTQRGFFTAGTNAGGSAPDPWNVKIADRVAYNGMTFMRIA